MSQYHCGGIETGMDAACALCIPGGLILLAGGILYVTSYDAGYEKEHRAGRVALITGLALVAPAILRLLIMAVML